MKFQGALIKEQNVTFAIVVVKESVLNSPSESRKIIQAFMPTFGNNPVVLMAQNSKGVPTYSGRSDIVKFLSKIDFRTIPWKEFTIRT